MMLVLLSLATLATTSLAFHIPVRSIRQPRSFIDKRGSGVLDNQNDLRYYTNITLGGTNFMVNIDTGSSDLWVCSATTVPGSVDTGKQGSISYAVGNVGGPIRTGSLDDFLGFTVKEQAFFQVTPDPSNPLAVEGQGLLGLGPRFGSNISAVLGSTPASVPVLDSIFLQNTSTPNFATYLLGRENDPTDPLDGNITISTILPGYEKILDQPKAPAISLLNNGGFTHWTLLIDAIKGPDGKDLNIKTNVPDSILNKLETKPQGGQVIGLMDTGFSYSQVPKAVADAFYSNIKGAKKIVISGSNSWVFPCTTELNVSVTIAGNEYRVHSLDASDLVTDAFSPADKAAVEAELKKEVDFDGDVCQGTFQESSSVVQSLPFDLILGMNFLRNVYELINHGDFVGDNNTARGDPYFQFLSTTSDPALTHQEFVKVRGNSSTSFNKSKGPLGLSWGAFAGIVAGIVLILLGLIIACCWKKKGKRTIASAVPIKLPFGGSRGKYAQVGTADDEGHLLKPTTSNLGPTGGGHAAEYYDAFDSRQSMERVSYDMGASGHGYSGQSGR